MILWQGAAKRGGVQSVVHTCGVSTEDGMRNAEKSLCFLGFKNFGGNQIACENEPRADSDITESKSAVWAGRDVELGGPRHRLGSWN